MRLTPKNPPGRLNRKALAFKSDIYRLRLDGHTCRAIHQTLLAAGLNVSLSTVKREIAKCAKCPRGDEATSPPVPLPREHAASHTQSCGPLPAFAGDPRSSKEIAESFVKARNSNPLMRARAA